MIQVVDFFCFKNALINCLQASTNYNEFAARYAPNYMANSIFISLDWLLTKYMKNNVNN